MNAPAPDADHDAALQFERLVFFSDAVFAIAITLLVLDLRLPAGVGVADGLARITPKLIGFGISFFVIGIYWIAHHRLFGTLAREDGRLRVVNLGFLASIIFLPFPTSVIAGGPPATAAVVLYALSAAAVGLLLILLIFAGRRPGLMKPGETRGGTLRLATRAFAAPAVFVVSAFVAVPAPRWAATSWLLIWPAVRMATRLGAWVQRRTDLQVRRGGSEA